MKKYFLLFKYKLNYKKINTIKHVNINYILLKNPIKKNIFSLNKRIFLRKRLINANIMNYFYKSYKKYTNINYNKLKCLKKNIFKQFKKKKKITFLNFDKPLLEKLRETRKIH